MRKARVILLNGPGSAGKTTLARALQGLAARPLLMVSLDRTLERLPVRFQDDPRWFGYRRQGARCDVTVGPEGAALLDVMRQEVAPWAGAGFDIVVDDVWLAGEPAGYTDLLAPFAVWRVGVMAPLAVLAAREAVRGDRLPGLARAQHRSVHRGVRHDLWIDTESVMPEGAARQVAALAGLA